jgi:tryptophan-rich sensory protein
MYEYEYGENLALIDSGTRIVVEPKYQAPAMSGLTGPDAPLTFSQRIKRFDFIFIYAAILIVTALFFVSYIPGIYSDWYENLKHDGLNVWIPRVAWVVTTALSYVGLYFLWQNSSAALVRRNLAVSALYLVGSFMILAWSAALYQHQDIGLAVWFSAILFIYQFWIFIYIWYIKPLAAIFILPLVLMYLYLVYSMIHLASINNVPL